MTEIAFKKNKAEDWVGYVVSGHTGYAEAGEDIVCAAVSTAATMCLNGITEVLGAEVGYEVGEAYLECVLPEKMPEKTRDGCRLLIDTLYLTLEDLKKQYGKHITITVLEV